MSQPGGSRREGRGAAAEADEARLLARVASKDRAAFEALYHRYHSRLFNYLFKVTRKADQVEEVLNDVMLVIWRKAASFDARSRPSTWIFGIAYRKALKALSRRETRMEANSYSSDDSDHRERLVPTEAAPDAGPELRLVRRELVSSLSQAMARLSPEHRAVLELTYTYGYSCKEIAELVGCPVNTVKTRMFHARRRLRETLPELETWAPIFRSTHTP